MKLISKIGLLALMIALNQKVSAQLSFEVNEGDTVYLDFTKNEGEVFSTLMKTRIIKLGVANKAGYAHPFHAYGIIGSTESDKKGRTWVNIKLYKCYQYASPMIVRAYDLPESIASGEIIPMRQFVDFYEFFFLDEDRNKARELASQLERSEADIERYRNMLKNMIAKSYDHRYEKALDSGML